MEYGFEILVFEEKKSKSKYHKSGFATLSSNSWLICHISPRSYTSNQFPTANILLLAMEFHPLSELPPFWVPKNPSLWEQDPQKRIAVIIAKPSALCLPGSGSTNTVGSLLRFAVCTYTWEVAPPAVPLGETVFGPPRVRGGRRRPRFSWNKDSETCVLKAEILAECDDVILKNQRCFKLNCELKKEVWEERFLKHWIWIWIWQYNEYCMYL